MFTSHKVELKVRWFETDDEVVRSQYLIDTQMTEEQIMKLGFSEITEIRSHYNESAKDGIITKSLADGRTCLFISET